MAGKQVITTTVFGSGIAGLASTFSTFRRTPDTELHAFVYGEALPAQRVDGIHYHLVQPDLRFLSVRRDALFRRWTFPDQLEAEYALVVDGTDVICLQDLPPFADLLRGAGLAAATEWVPPSRIPGQGYTSCYLNAGVTFWHLPSTLDLRAEIAERGRRHYRGPFDDQTALNEVAHTKYYDRLVLLPSQYNWRALFRKNFRSWHHHWRNWPRVDSLDGVVLYHNQHCAEEVLRESKAHPPARRAVLPNLPQDPHPLTPWQQLRRRFLHRWFYS